jgi:hypothetical protein
VLRRLNLVQDRISTIERKFDLDEALPGEAA